MHSLQTPSTPQVCEYSSTQQVLYYFCWVSAHKFNSWIYIHKKPWVKMLMRVKHWFICVFHILFSTCLWLQEREAPLSNIKLDVLWWFLIRIFVDSGRVDGRVSSRLLYYVAELAEEGGILLYLFWDRFRQLLGH